MTCINGGGSTASQNAYVGKAIAGGFGGGALFQYATASPAFGFSYEGGQSTPAQQAVRDNLPSLFTGNTAETGYAVHFGTSESYVNAASPLATYVGPNHPLPGGGGQFLQIPMWLTTDVIAVNNPGNTYNGAIILNDTDLCGIFSGLITNWKATSAYPHAKAGPIKVYWRSDNAGASASFQLTQHLAAVCNASNTQTGIAFKLTSKFAQLFPGTVAPPSDGKSTWSIPVGTGGLFANFVPVTGSAGMADGVNNDATGSAIGYVSPDYSAIAATPIASKTSKPFNKLYVAALTNRHDGKSHLPTPTKMLLALSNPGAATVSAPPALTFAAASVQTNWAPTIADPLQGYPIINFSLLFVPQCYANPAIGNAIIAVVNNTINHVYDNAILNSGFASAQAGGQTKWGGAIQQALLTNSHNLNLNIGNAKACAGIRGR